MNIRFQDANFRFRAINSEFRGCACVFYGVSSGAGRALMFCGVKNSFLYACGTMRHECFSQIGFRKTDSDIYGANSWVQRVNIRFQCANSGFPCANIRVGV